MSIHSHQQSGFSAVELLVALFVATVFLAAGHQLYITIVNDSGEARQRAQASNIAYNTLRRYADSAPGACTASTPVNNVAVDPVPEGLANVRHTVTYSCPQASMSNITKVQVTVTYGADSKEVVHAMYSIQ